MTLQGQANPERPNLNGIYVCHINGDDKHSCQHFHHNPHDRVHPYHCNHDGTAIWWDPDCWGCDYHTTRNPKSKSHADQLHEQAGKAPQTHHDTKHSRS